MAASSGSGRSGGSTPTCGTYGYSSTGVINLDEGLIYAISADGWLHALSLATGVERPGWPIAMTVPRNQVEYVWGGLRILNGRLYLGVASYCDAPDANNVAAEGRLVSINLDNPTDVATFDPVPGYGNLGGIWSWCGGISVEPGGSFIYTGVGNSYVLDNSCGCYTDTAGYGDSMLKLTAGLQVVAANRPAAIDPTADDDFGASPVLFQPPGCRPTRPPTTRSGSSTSGTATRSDKGRSSSSGWATASLHSSAPRRTQPYNEASTKPTPSSPTRTANQSVKASPKSASTSTATSTSSGEPKPETATNHHP